MTLESTALLTTLGEPVAVVAPRGTGKSTTLVQLAECMGTQKGPIPLLVPLGEWSDRQEDFFEFILRRNAFGTFRRQHLMQLAYRGRLTLLLDGWNELTPEAPLRATHDVTALRRDYAQLGVVIAPGARRCNRWTSCRDRSTFARSTDRTCPDGAVARKESNLSTGHGGPPAYASSSLFRSI